MRMRMRWLGAAAAAVVLAGALGACGEDSVASGPAQVDPTADASDAPADATSAPPSDAAVDATGPFRADFGLDVRPANTTCKAPARPPGASPVELLPVLTHVAFPGGPLALAQIPGDMTRWFAAMRDGRIVTFPNVDPAVGTIPTQVAEIGALSGYPVLQDGEGGLLGIAFHPKFALNGQLFLSWTTLGASGSGIRSVVGRITSTDGGTTWGQYQTILGPFDQPPADNHKGGTVRFGPDGFLYLSFGDGGGGGDTYMHGQTTTGFFSKILRIDVDNVPAGQTYGIPDGNPFKNGGGEPATFARGFRNPFRFSIDSATGDVWVGDVGQDLWEEIDVVRAGGNYGWPCREGKHDYTPAVCLGGESLLDPIHEYGHNGASAAVTGGVVYRGSQIPGFTGSYVFGDSYSNDLFALTFDPTTGAATSTVLNANARRGFWVDFVEGQDGEIYALDFYALLFKIVASQPAAPSTFPDRLSKTGCVDPADARKPAAGLVPYDVNSPFWSDGADKERFLALPDGKTITVGADGDFDFPIGSVLMKTFSLGGKKIETRLFVRHDDGEWAGYDYEWNDAQTDAVLLPSSKTKKIGTQTWSFPSRGQCINCHTPAAGHTLGLELGQLNGDFVYTKTNRVSNQLATLEHIGMLSAPLAAPIASTVVYPRPTGAAPLEARARSYLQANCSHCHRPTGPGGGGLDLRFATPLAGTKACGNAPQLGDLGVAGAKVLAPGSPASSVLALRPHALGAARMPPLSSTVVDTAGVKVLDDWIKSVAACP